MPGVILYRQRDHAAVAYPSRRHPAATVATSGCGPTALSMVLANLLGLAVSPAETAAFALEHGARAEGGTNMRRLAAQAALRWPLRVTETCDTAELIAALQGGAMAICNTAGDRPGRKGVFSSGGHYVVAAGGDERGACWCWIRGSIRANTGRSTGPKPSRSSAMPCSAAPKPWSRTAQQDRPGIIFSGGGKKRRPKGRRGWHGGARKAGRTGRN